MDARTVTKAVFRVIQERISSGEIEHICDSLRADADEVICAVTPDLFLAVGAWYRGFDQTSDEAHNSHLGDVRATELGRRGEWNVGQLARDHYGRDAVLIGFTTYTGTVTAASNWNGPAEQKRVRPALPESWEALFHDLAIPDFLWTVTDGASTPITIPEPLLERAIGVIYLPGTERVSHYFFAELQNQFDSILHFDVTRVVAVV